MTAGLALPALALDADAGLKASVIAEAQTSASEASGGVSLDTNLGAGVNNVVNARIGTKGSASAGSADASVSSGVAGTDDSVGNASGSASAGIQVLVVTQRDVAVEGDTGAVVSIAPTSVKTQADLDGFVRASLKADKNVAKVAASPASVEVTYKQPVKLLGFIPVRLNARAAVDAGGNVDVRYPWYAFLASTNEAELEAKLESRISAMLGADGGAHASADAAAELAADAQARLVAEIQATLESELEVSVAAQASGSVGAR